jgi:YVTN family beta-propeller protein
VGGNARWPPQPDKTVVNKTLCLRFPTTYAQSTDKNPMKISSLARVALILSLSSFAMVSMRGDEVNYQLLKTIPVGGEGGWDYLSVDSAGRRLYVSHGSKAVVIDLEKETVVGEITNTPGIHGIAVAPKLGRAFTSNGRENKISIVDLKTLETRARVDTGENPDAILFEPGREEVYAFNGRSKNATVLDAKNGKVVATIPLGGKPEFAQSDGGRVFVNIEDKNEVAVIDTAKRAVVAHWPIAPGEGASGMAIDAKNHRLFLGADKMMVMLDYTTGKVVGSVPIGDGVDANSFDPATQLAFASCRDGTTTIAHEDSPDKLTVVQTLKTARGSRTMTLDPATHKIYLSAADYEKGSEGQRRPNPVAGSFKVLVFGPAAAESAPQK